MTPYRCRSCGDADHIDIAANVWVRLIQTEGSDEFETDADEADDHDQTWGDDSAAVCRSCGEDGTAYDFEVWEAAHTPEQCPEPAPVDTVTE